MRASNDFAGTLLESLAALACSIGGTSLSRIVTATCSRCIEAEEDRDSSKRWQSSMQSGRATKSKGPAFTGAVQKRLFVARNNRRGGKSTGTTSRSVAQSSAQG